VAQLFSLGSMTRMKTTTSMFLFCLLIFSSGCLSTKTVQRAQGTVPGNHTDETGAHVYDKRPEPGYYCLLPLTVPLDIATSPIQIPVWIYLEASAKHSGWE